jgi:elongation factor G
VPLSVVAIASDNATAAALQRPLLSRGFASADAARQAKASEDNGYLSQMRNIGISAHIDSGKTTLTERILYYTGRIRNIHEVRGKDGVGAKMDSMDLEREKGITIKSAATYCAWGDTAVNIIDTPGHVDFTVEVERALRVLDGAVLVLCSVGGVQSQSITVDRQMRRYDVPRVCFVNKCDRMGADPFNVMGQLREKLKHTAAALQVPIGLEDAHKGVVDLVKMEAVYFEGPKGDTVRREAIPDDLADRAAEARAELIEVLADVDDELADIYLSGEEPSAEQLRGAVRRATLALKFTPVFMGSAFKNKGVQLLLDGVLDYLPAPNDVANTALDVAKDEEPLTLPTDASANLVALAFKLEDGKFGQLTYMRLYSGTLKKGDFITNVKSRKRVKVPRLVRMHSDDMEDITEAKAGDIVAIFGVECASGDTFTDGKVDYAMSSMHTPDPVMSLAVSPKDQSSAGNFSKALGRFQREDPTFRVHLDPDSNQTIISGMGELHLEIYIERMKREYNTDVVSGKPQVNFRETIRAPAKFDYTHKKQSGGSGQFGKVQGRLEPILTEAGLASNDVEFEVEIVGNPIPPQLIPSVEKGFREAANSGSLVGHAVQGVRFVLEDGASHVVDSNDVAFRLAAQGAFRQAYAQADPTVLEPIMAVEITAPTEFQGSVIGSINKRSGTILGSESDESDVTVNAAVPLNNMFGYSTDLRSQTQGKGEFSMVYDHHAPVTAQTQKELVTTFARKRAGKD